MVRGALASRCGGEQGGEEKGERSWKGGVNHDRGMLRDPGFIRHHPGWGVFASIQGAVAVHGPGEVVLGRWEPLIPGLVSCRSETRPES